MNGVILYGPPAVGKDTVTAALAAEQSGFVHYRRLKCGPGRTAGYRMISSDDLATLPADKVLWTNRRYSAVYLVERDGLGDIWRAGDTPVVHLGQPEAVVAVVRGTPNARWLVVDLHAPMPMLRERIQARGTGDDDARLAVAAQTPRLAHSDLVIDTGITAPAEAAVLIAERFTQQHAGTLRPRR